MKKTTLLFALLCVTNFAIAQKHAYGLRLAYFTGKYNFSPYTDVGEATWKEQPEGLEGSVFYRIALGHSPLYVQTELTFYNRRIEGTLPWFIPYGLLVNLKGSQSLLQVPLIVGGQFGRGRLHGFIAVGASYGLVIRKNWTRTQYLGADGKAEIGGGEFGGLAEGGLLYDLPKHLQLGIGYRYIATQHGLTVKSSNGSVSDIWHTNRTMPELSIGRKF